jgi:hypothetical protein
VNSLAAFNCKAIIYDSQCSGGIKWLLK